MSRLEEIKNEIVQEYGYKSFEEFDDKSTFSYDHDTPEIIKNIALKYAKECVEASLEKASRIAKIFKNSNSGSYLDASIDKKTITNETNIVLL